jgi:hypothetical protein
VISLTPLAALLPEKELHTHWIGGWMGPRTGLDDVERRESFPLSGIKLRPVARRYTDCTIPVLMAHETVTKLRSAGQVLEQKIRKTWKKEKKSGN